ncbi:MAG TPA: hypothetical protein VK993_04790 [Chthoniobacterales bacterium]|nr:hypothetical protein [Chthoniobacterales bacterium]
MIVLNVAVIPLLRGEGGPGSTFHWSHYWGERLPQFFPMDSLRIDVIGTTAREVHLDASFGGCCSGYG